MNTSIFVEVGNGDNFVFDLGGGRSPTTTPLVWRESGRWLCEAETDGDKRYSPPLSESMFAGQR
jgi:hypothetical protein